MNSVLQQLMLPQFAVASGELLFNKLLERSPHLSAILRKLDGKMLQIQLNQPTLSFYILFSEKRTDWLSNYEGEADCCVSLEASVLPKLADKSKLTELINNKSLVLQGDIQVLQHFTQLLEQLEKDPAELLSPFVGDVVAQSATDFARSIAQKAKNQFVRSRQNVVDNLLNERPVLVHRLELAYFCDQVEELAQQAVRLEQKFAKMNFKER